MPSSFLSGGLGAGSSSAWKTVLTLRLSPFTSELGEALPEPLILIKPPSHKPQDMLHLWLGTCLSSGTVALWTVLTLGQAHARTGVEDTELQIKVLL